MQVDLVPVPESQKAELWAALQRYLAELSTLGGRQAVNGIYSYRYLDSYWREPTRWPWWIKWDGRIAGFAMVRQTEDGVFEMAEFCVEPEFRRAGLATDAALALFARFAGRWELSEFRENLPAISFWRRVSRTFPNFRESAHASRVVQSFTTGRNVS